MKITAQDKVDIILLYESGISIKDIAKTYEVSTEIIRKYVVHIGKPYYAASKAIEATYLDRAKQQIKEDTEALLVSKIKLLAESGLTQYKILEIYGNHARHLAKKYKLSLGQDYRRDGFAVMLTYKGKTYHCKTVYEAAKISGYSQSAISNALSGRYHLSKATVKYAD